MNRNEFLEVLVETIETDADVTESTVLTDIEEWDSLAAVTTLALFNKKLGLKITAADLEACKTVSDLLNLGNANYA